MVKWRKEKRGRGGHCQRLGRCTTRHSNTEAERGRKPAKVQRHDHIVISTQGTVSALGCSPTARPLCSSVLHGLPPTSPPHIALAATRLAQPVDCAALRAKVDDRHHAPACTLEVSTTRRMHRILAPRGTPHTTSPHSRRTRAPQS